jgi:hypothetical protein
VTDRREAPDFRSHVLSALNAVPAGEEPPAALLEDIGGWKAVAEHAPSLIDDPLLAPLTALACRYVEAEDVDRSAVNDAAVALVEAVVSTADPNLFGQAIDYLCSSPELVALVGARLASALWPHAQPPPADPTLSLAAAHRSADALEAYLRLTLAGHAPKYRLYSLFEEVKQPTSRRYAQAVIRAIAAAHDRWVDLDDGLIETIDVLSGAVAPRFGATLNAGAASWSREQTEGIATDAAWAKANIELLRGLRAPEAAQTLQHVEEARLALAPAVSDEAAIDAGTLDVLLNVLSQFLQGVTAGEATPAVNADTVADLQERLRRFEIGALGLQHWTTDRKSQVLVGWTRLAQDLDFLRDHLDRPSLYDAAVVLDDVLEIYTASRSGDFISHRSDIEGVQRILQPSIIRSFATRVGLLRNLSDHVEALKVNASDAASPDHGSAATRLSVAESVLEAARAEIERADPSGKDDGAVAASLPPLIDELVTSADARAALADLSATALAQLNQDLQDRRFAHHIVPHISIAKVTRTIRAALADCRDYRADVQEAVDHLLDLLVRYLYIRINIESRYKPYLFTPDANEQDLHLDLWDWLAGHDLAGYVDIEAMNVASGRADIRLSYGPFHLYLELKADDTQVPLAEKKAYIQQTVAYHGADVQISFLVVLRLAPNDHRGAPPHISALVSHTTVTIGEGSEPRHVVMIEVPGNRLRPSSMRLPFDPGTAVMRTGPGTRRVADACLQKSGWRRDRRASGPSLQRRASILGTRMAGTAVRSGGAGFGPWRSRTNPVERTQAGLEVGYVPAGRNARRGEASALRRGSCRRHWRQGSGATKTAEQRRRQRYLEGRSVAVPPPAIAEVPR